ncbi:MAG TPA: hypothetical protein VIL03_05735 [Clostridia bacterium]|jgi:hypothetical protein
MDIVALPIEEAIKIIKSKNLNYKIIRINEASDKDDLERVIRYSLSDNNIILTTAYFKNGFRIKNG